MMMVREDSFSLEYVPDWLVTQKQIELWHDDDYFYDDDEIIKWTRWLSKT